MRRTYRQIATAAALLVGSSMGCSGASETENSANARAGQVGEAREANEPREVQRPAAAAPPDTRAPIALRTQIDGRAFPDHVLALTWDDGPDVNTLALADYLNAQKIAATFFVVREWVGSFSSDPGQGAGIPNTGYDAIPILGDLVQLGHRLGNHTLNHVLFRGESPEAVDAQIAENQARIDPFTINELRIFRAPGGAWDTSVSSLIGADPALQHLVGPVRWDVDRKDWEGSLSCRSDHPRAECEHAGPGKGLRVKPSVIARRYLESIEEAGHGIVLFHDRVGDVGSRYALEIARAIVPQLQARGYVFAAPVLEFSAFTTRGAMAGDAREGGHIRLADLDGDGRQDLCTSDDARTVCALSTAVAPIEKGGMPSTTFRALASIGARIDAANARAPELGDVDGDGQADACTKTSRGVTCLLGAPRAGSPERIAGFGDAGDPEGTLLLGDLDGDGKADACMRIGKGVVCARSLGTGFERARSWLDAPFAPSASMRLGDVDGDGRADLCVATADGVACASSTGTSFGRLAIASSARHGTPPEFLLGDLNGDGRADLCMRQSGGVDCALSLGHTFTRATRWLAGDPGPGAQLADINGDGRADLCGRAFAQDRREDRDAREGREGRERGPDAIACALAP